MNNDDIDRRLDVAHRALDLAHIELDFLENAGLVLRDRFRTVRWRIDAARQQIEWLQNHDDLHLFGEPRR